MAGRLTGPDLAEWTVDKFLETEFEGGRHKRRVDKISSMEDNL
jgi:ribose 5-phosphate isomerase B